jgi:RND family efflux transporter MFP subunit
MNKRILAAAALLMMATACGNHKSDNNNSDAKLDQLKQQREKLNAEIQQLESQKGVDSNAAGMVTVSVANEQPTVFRHYLEVQGKVESNSNIYVTPKVPGAMVTELLVNRGDNVSKGQVLARLDASVLQQSIAEMQNQLNLTKTVYERQKNLWDQKIGSEIQFITAKNNYESMQSRMSTLRQQLDMYTLRSPISGTVDDVTLKAGEIPAPGVSGIRVVNPDDVKITAEVSEAYIAKVNKGDSVRVYLPDLGKEMQTRVKTVSKVINPTNRTFLIELDPQQGENELRPNMIAVVKVNDYINKNAIVLPINLVQSDENGNFVYVAVKNGNGWTVDKKTVKTGENYQGQVEILSGLTPQDQVITEGYQSVVDGQQIAIGK